MIREMTPGMPASAWARTGAPPTAWLETLIISAALPVLGLLLHAEDPFFLRSGFFWLSLAPLLTALRYGFAHGFVSAALLTAGMVAHEHFSSVGEAELPVGSALALAVTGMLAGAWSDWWAQRLAQVSAENAYHRQRLDEFTTAYHLLRISHERLSHRVAASTDSLRDTLQRLYGHLQRSAHPHAPLRGMGADVLGLFGNFTWVQVAALYAVDDDGRLRHPAEATLGEPATVDVHNPLVTAALRERQLVAATAADNRERTGGLLACAPIVDGDDRCHALLVIERMPFMNFTGENLRLLAVLAAHVGHLLARVEATTLDGATEFSRHLQRALADLREFALPATLVTLHCPAGQQGADVADFALTQTRGLDRPWQARGRGGTTLFCLLMPLTTDEEAGRYLERLETALGKRRAIDSLADLARRSSGGNFAALGVVATVRSLRRGDGATALLDTLVTEYGIDCGDLAGTGSLRR